MGLVDDGEDFFFAEQEVELFIELHFRAGVLADENLVADLDVEGDFLAVLVEGTGAKGNDLGFLWLLLGGVGDDDASLDFFGLFDALEEDAITEGLDARFGVFGHVDVLGRG